MTRGTLRILIVLAPLALSAACDTGPVEDDLDIGEESFAVESYFCVDHPCPDLKPFRYGECWKWLGNTMPVKVQNIGSATAGPSTALFELDYYSYEQEYSVSSLAPGAYQWVFVSLPTECTTGPGCVWFLHADSTEVVTEINGNNNTVWGACIN